MQADLSVEVDQESHSRTVIRELPADLDTPVSVYMRLMGQGASFLLESVTGGEQVARYSFIGVHANQAVIVRGQYLEVHHADGEIERRELPPEGDPFAGLAALLARYRRSYNPELPRFTGGFVGYMGYEMMRFFEPAIALQPHPELPDAIFIHADTVVAFDHAFGRLLLITNILESDGLDDREALEQAEARLDEIQRRLRSPIPVQSGADGPIHSSEPAPWLPNMSRESFTGAVERAREYIAAGDIFQVVLSQRLARETSAQPFSIYRALRRLNPSPYMFYLDFGKLAGEEPFQLIGASPEVHVRLEDRTASLRPIAGTRPRGKSAAEDQRLERELLADPKERAEHIMLVDLARNDLGRVCEYGSVRVPEQMVIERYSHVMHIVSHTEGQLRPDQNALDLLRATFPAGTVSGAPKIRAMQIIDELEPDRRGPYAGAVGHLGYDGKADTCIAIRTLIVRGNRVSVQAGAGIVADSDPESEYQETLNKARALAEAVEIAESMPAIRYPDTYSSAVPQGEAAEAKDADRH